MGAQPALYNYVVSGESRSYRYAQDNYSKFAFSSRSEAWYRRLRDRAGFIVTESVAEAPARFDLQHRLHEALGSAGETGPGLAHYRAGYASPDGTVKVFTLVPGATLIGSVDGADGSPVVRKTFSPAGLRESRTSRRRVEPEEDGSFAVTVAHPGWHEIRHSDGVVLTTVTVPEEGVLRGRTVTVGRVGSP